MFGERPSKSRFLLYGALIAAGYIGAYLQFVSLSPFTIVDGASPRISYKSGHPRILFVTPSGLVQCGTLEERMLDLLLEHPKNLERVIEDLTQQEPLIYRK